MRTKPLSQREQHSLYFTGGGGSPSREAPQLCCWVDQVLCALTKDLDYSAATCQCNPSAVCEVLASWEIDAGRICELHGLVAPLDCTLSLRLTNQLSFLPESLIHSLVFLIESHNCSGSSATPENVNHAKEWL